MPNGQSKTEQEEFEAENGVPLEQGTTLGTTLVSAARAVWYRLIFYRDVFGAFAAVAAADKRANSEAFSTAETVASRYQTLPEWMDERRGAQSVRSVRLDVGGTHNGNDSFFRDLVEVR